MEKDKIPSQTTNGNKQHKCNTKQRLHERRKNTQKRIKENRTEMSQYKVYENNRTMTFDIYTDHPLDWCISIDAMQFPKAKEIAELLCKKLNDGDIQ